MNKFAPLDFHGTLTAKPEAVTPHRVSIFKLNGDDDDTPPERKCPYIIL